MKMNRGIAKRALGLGLAIVMALSVTACGKKQSGEPGAAGGQQEQSGGGQQVQAAGGEKIVNVGVTDTLNTLNPPSDGRRGDQQIRHRPDVPAP